MLTKIISGGQAGVDRAALDVALELGIPCGGWCPKGRPAEDGRIPDRYPLTEMPTDSYAARTRKNVEEADATLLLVGRFGDQRAGGTRLTLNATRELGKPCLLVDLSWSGVVNLDPHQVEDWRRWVCSWGVLNVAGPRESKRRGIYERARAFLLAVLSPNTASSTASSTLV